MQRRDFLKSTGVGMAAMALPADLWALNRATRIDAIGIQLYTVRAAMQKDFEGTLTAIAGIGYKEVEFAGYFGKTPTEVRALLDRLKLTSPSTHLALADTEANFDKLAEGAHIMGHEWLTVASLNNSDWNTQDAIKRTADRFNALGRRCRTAGLRYAYHNHDYEFRLIEGKRMMDALLENTSPDVVEYEMDLFWIIDGGGDPLDYFNRFPGRWPMVHVKDMGSAPDKKMVDAGQGVIDWKGIFAQQKRAGIRHFFVEHDNPTDAIADAKVSFDYLNKLAW